MTSLQVPFNWTPVCFLSSCSTRSAHLVSGCSSAVAPSVVDGRVENQASERDVIRLGLPSKGRMAEETLNLLKDCQLSVRQVNPRQYVAAIPQVSHTHTKIIDGMPVSVEETEESISAVMDSVSHVWSSEQKATGSMVMKILGSLDTELSNLEVWFQRPKDIVRKLLTGDLDLGIVGLDTVCEHGKDEEDLILVHDSLGFGDCRLSLAIPKYGIFENINSVDELAQMSQWTPKKPLRIVTGFTYLGPKFVKEKGLTHVTFSTADGALEAAPAMGIADAILDLVSSGTTLRENNLKEIDGGVVLESEAVLLASKQALIRRKGVLDTTHEILERLEAHLLASGQFTVTANMRGVNAEEVAKRVLSQPSLSGLQGPTISPVFCKRDGNAVVDYYAIVICVPKKALYKSVQQLRAIGGSGILVSPLTYIFEEETPRWPALLRRLGL